MSIPRITGPRNRATRCSAPPLELVDRSARYTRRGSADAAHHGAGRTADAGTRGSRERSAERSGATADQEPGRAAGKRAIRAVFGAARQHALGRTEIESAVNESEIVEGDGRHR